MNNKLSELFTAENDSRILELETRLLEFYKKPEDYPVFNQISHKSERWLPIVKAIEKKIADHGYCRILEIGAGKSGFGSAISYLRENVHWTVQDITDFNKEYLQNNADSVFIGNIDKLEGKFDIIFSFFVFEHLTHPHSTLVKFFALLNSGGILFVNCPRYDFPFYLSHSADHYSKYRRFKIAINLIYLRFKSYITKIPIFLIHLDPALFHMDFYRDRDAIHWVSRHSIYLVCRNYGEVEYLKLPTHGLKDWIVKRYLEVAIMISKDKIS